MTTFYELDLASVTRNPSNVTTLPGAPLRTLDGRLLSELSEYELEVEIVKRRILGAPSLFADFKDEERN